MLKQPESELGKLTGLHGEGSSPGKATWGETGARVQGADGDAPWSQNLFKIQTFQGNKTYL